MTYSIDLSHNNDQFNWEQLSPDINLVICKATEGATFRDNMLPHYLSETATKAVGLGLYHFLHFNVPAVDQAKNFLDYCSSCGIEWDSVDMIALDVENTNEDAWVEQHQSLSQALVQDWLNIVQEATGRKSFIYTYKGFWVPTLGNPKTFAGYPLWVASYQDAAPGMFGGWTTSQLWQFSQRGSHISANDGGDIDWSKTMLSLEEIKTL